MKARICISSPPDREKLVAEVFFGSDQFAEINQESQQLEIEFYPKPSGTPWLIPLQEVFDCLEQARLRLINM